MVWFVHLQWNSTELKKFQFALDTVDFVGLTITPTNIQPSANVAVFQYDAGSLGQ